MHQCKRLLTIDCRLISWKKNRYNRDKLMVSRSYTARLSSGTPTISVRCWRTADILHPVTQTFICDCWSNAKRPSHIEVSTDHNFDTVEKFSLLCRCPLMLEWMWIKLLGDFCSTSATFSSEAFLDMNDDQVVHFDFHSQITTGWMELYVYI